jgi:hypothetical protein
MIINCIRISQNHYLHLHMRIMIFSNLIRTRIQTYEQSINRAPALTFARKNGQT